MILLCAAVAKELTWWSPRPSVETLVTGVGPVEAGCAVAAALAQRRYRLVVNVGVAGAIAGCARVGDAVAVADEVMELDLESGAPLLLPGDERTIEHASSDAALVRALHALGYAALRGITVARVTTTATTARRLAARGVQVESMEGFAVLRAAARAGIRAVELRGISNYVGERAQSGWDLDAGIAATARIAHALFAVLDSAEAHREHA